MIASIEHMYVVLCCFIIYSAFIYHYITFKSYVLQY